MTLPDSAFPVGHQFYGSNYQIITRITIENNELVDNTWQDGNGNLLKGRIRTQKGELINVNPQNCEWLSQTFFRNEDDLYGFSVIVKSNSSKMFFTKVKEQVDFDSFVSIGKNFAKDKNNYYFGPRGKVIKEDHLQVYFDESYKEGLVNQNVLGLWNSKVATASEKVYWDGVLLKGVHSSLKRVCHYLYADQNYIYEFNLQKIKKIEGVDRASFVCYNYLKNKSIKSLASDKFKPVYCYTNKRELNEDFDFEYFRPLFEHLRGKISSDYWWYELEERFAKTNTIN